jgi:hypothetical protein
MDGAIEDNRPIECSALSHHMASKRRKNWVAEEIADFLACCPSPEERLAYHPSIAIQNRAGADRRELRIAHVQSRFR